MSIGIVIPLYFGGDYIEQCLQSILKQENTNFRIAVIDNGGEDNGRSIVRDKFANQVVCLRNKTNVGVARAWNQGAKFLLGVESSIDAILFLNQDVILEKDCLAQFYKFITDNRGVGVVGAQLLYSDETIQHAGGRINWEIGRGTHPQRNQLRNITSDPDITFDYITGACLLISRNAYQRIQGVDEWFSPAYYEDVDLCVRVKDAGYTIAYLPYVCAYHSEGSSLGNNFFLKKHLTNLNRLRFIVKHYHRLSTSRSFADAELEYYNNKSKAYQNVLKNVYHFDWKNELATRQLPDIDLFLENIYDIRAYIAK